MELRHQYDKANYAFKNYYPLMFLVVL